MSDTKILAGVPDLFFSSKISQTAKLVGARVEFLNSQQAILSKASEGARLVILDLGQGSLDPISLIAKLKADPGSARVRLVAFANHERSDLMDGAKQAGCDDVLTRGAFAQLLPELLQAADESVKPDDSPAV